MLTFDPQYIRPDDVGTQRNKSLLLTKPESVQEMDGVAYRDRDRADNEAASIPVVTHERRKTASRDRRQDVRRQKHQLQLLDTRSNRERRKQLRRQHDADFNASHRSGVGVNELV